MKRVAAGGVEWSVRRVADCVLRADAYDWPFAKGEAAAIDAHWSRRKAEQPGFFNGRVLMMTAASMQTSSDGSQFSATLFEADFKSFLYWRETGHRDRTVRDAFGSALILSAEGYILLGRQHAGNINGGLAYPPGGFIDRRDIGSDGTIDIVASTAREVAEETGLDEGDLDPRGGLWLTTGGIQVSMAKEFRSPLEADALRARILERLAADPDPELADICIVRSIADIAALGDGVPDFARVLVAAVLERT
jgi:hypothetical protein